MKKIIYILIIFTGIIFSCESILDEPVYSYRLEKDIFSSNEATKAFLDGTYSRLNDLALYGGVMQQNLAWHSGVLGRRAGDQPDYASLTINSYSKWMKEIYGKHYQMITDANTLLHYIDSEVSDELRNATGLAYFIRGFSYFNLVRIYGAVPLVTEHNNNIIVSAKPRAKSIAEVYEQIVSDFNNAYNLMDSVQTDITLPKRLAAYAMLAKVYLTWAGQDNNFNSSVHWQLARDFADSVIAREGQLEGYSLFSDYSELFSPDNEYNTESIFEISNGSEDGAGSSLTNYYAAFSSGWANFRTGGWGRIVVMREIIDTLNATHNGRDNRMLTNIVDPSYPDKFNTNKLVFAYPSLGGRKYQQLPGFAKYKDPDASKNDSEINFPIFRYAEIFLIRAEADNEISNGPTPQAIDDINKLLSRSRNSSGGADTIPVDIQASDFTGVPGKTAQEAFADRIGVERLAELLGENNEWFDARRYGWEHLRDIFEAHNNRLDSAKAQNIFKATVDFYFPTDENSVKKHMLWPIPQEEINQNGMISEEDQNPGY